MVTQKNTKERLNECFDILSEKYNIDIQDCIDFKDLIEDIK